MTFIFISAKITTKFQISKQNQKKKWIIYPFFHFPQN